MKEKNLFTQLDMYNIIIVAEKKLKRNGRALVHVISKIRKDKVVLFSPKQYEDNEARITGRQKVIFLGKNKVSKDFIPLIKKKYEKFGIIWGYDFSKALIYIEDSFINKKILIEEIKRIAKEEKENTLKGSVRSAVSSSLIMLVALFPFGIVGAFIAGLAGGHTYNLLEKRKTISIQYRLGMISFIKDGFDKFIEDKDEQL